MMRIIIYVLERIETGKRYVGITNDLPRRLSEHRSKRTIAGQLLGKFRLLHTESSSNYPDARLREKYFKSSTGRHRLSKALTPKDRATPWGLRKGGESMPDRKNFVASGQGVKYGEGSILDFLRSIKRGLL